MTETVGAFLLKLAIFAPPILMALTVHEAAHGFVALLRGDPTAKLAGRLTLNPLRHLDLAGTLFFFFTAWAGAGFGWAKPVPVNMGNLRDPRRDGMLISAAGPVTNILAAMIFALGLNLVIDLGFFRDPALWKFYIFQMLKMGVFINVILACFNLIPLPPLDGSGVLAGLLSPRAAARYYQYQRYGFPILLALLFLPRLLPGFPDFIGFFVLKPAGWIVGLMLPEGV